MLNSRILALGAALALTIGGGIAVASAVSGGTATSDRQETVDTHTVTTSALATPLASISEVADNEQVDADVSDSATATTNDDAQGDDNDSQVEASDSQDDQNDSTVDANDSQSSDSQAGHADGNNGGQSDSSD